MLRRTMKKIIVAIFALLSLTILIYSSTYSNNSELILNETPTQVCFSPDGGCTEAIVKEINNAKSEILVQAYSFTSKDIASAIVKAHKLGVRVEIILDKSNRSKKYSAGDFTAHMGIPTYIDSVHSIAHNKIMIIDRETVITGSFNFTKAAEVKNAENLLIMKNKELAGIYIKNWEKHREHSENYAGR
jgi:phosphatidylserine/phosphatidylglycerophosphate/cardiolipin synthase-like enzyme